MDFKDKTKEEKLSDILNSLVSQNYELRAQNFALREAFLTFASSVLRRPHEDLLATLEDSEKYWHQFMLEKLEDHFPPSAAAIDQRTPSQIWIAPEDDQSPPTQ